MALGNLKRIEDIEEMKPSLNDAGNKIKKAKRFLDFAERAQDMGDPEMTYGQVYDASRIACDSLLALEGFRVKRSSQKHHFTVISAAKELMQGELEKEFNRMQKMRTKRNKLEYGNLDVISEIELKQAREDAKKLINEVSKKIKEKSSQQILL